MDYPILPNGAVEQKSTDEVLFHPIAELTH
jgi:hypothetical protein